MIVKGLGLPDKQEDTMGHRGDTKYDRPELGSPILKADTQKNGSLPRELTGEDIEFNV